MRRNPRASPRLGSLKIRPALKADLDRLLEIHVAAFPDARPFDVRRRVFLHNRLGEFRHARVVERAGEILGHAFAFPLEAYFAGKAVPIVGIASVGVAAEARGQGVATALLASIHDEAALRGAVISLLYPFREGFYERIGYGTAGRHRVLTFSPRAIPRAWRNAAAGVVRPLLPEDRDEIVEVYRANARRRTGYLERPAAAWTVDLLDERQQWLVLDEGASIGGYVRFAMEKVEPHGRVRARVQELIATNGSTTRRLLAAIGGLGDQVAEVVLKLADDDPLDWALVDADRDSVVTADVEHSHGLVSAGPMIRLLSVQRALLARGYGVDGAISLAVDDDTPFALVVEAGVARVARARGEAAIRMRTAALASVAFGGLSLEDAARLGWCEANDETMIGAASQLLRIPPFFSLDPF